MIVAPQFECNLARGGQKVPSIHLMRNLRQQKRGVGLLMCRRNDMVWIVRFVVAAMAAIVQWFVTPLFLRLGALQALLSLAVFFGVTFVLVLIPWPQERR
jgi:hypothetical protein